MTKRLMFVEAADQLSITEVGLEVDAGLTELNIVTPLRWGSVDNVQNVEIKEDSHLTGYAVFTGGMAYKGVDLGIITGDFTYDSEAYYNSLMVPDGQIWSMSLPYITTGRFYMFQMKSAPGYTTGILNIFPVGGPSTSLTPAYPFATYCTSNGVYIKVFQG